MVVISTKMTIRLSIVKTAIFSLITFVVACTSPATEYVTVLPDTSNLKNIILTDTASLEYKNAVKFSDDFDRGRKLFKQNCAVCHDARSDRPLTGPGLKNVTERIPSPTEQWFISYTLNSDSVFKSGDTYAKGLRKKFKNERMTLFYGSLSSTDVRQIYLYVATDPRQRGCVID